MNLFGKLRDRDVVIGTLGALLALTVLLFHLPAAIYSGNAADLAFGLGDFLLVALLLFIPALIAIVAILVALPRRARRVLAGMLCAIGVLFWLYGNFSIGDSLVLDGRQKEVRFATRLGWWEIPVLIAATLVLGATAMRFRRPAAIFLIALNIGLAAGTLWELVRDPRFLHPTTQADSSKLFRFSTQGNTLVVLMDSLQSDVFDRVTRADAAIRDALQGFTLYRDTLAVAPTTIFSIPAIHSGQTYRAGESIDDYYDRAIAKGSMLNRFAHAGHDATLVNTMRGVCPERATCLEPVHIVGSRAEELKKSSLRMLDFSLLRIAPFIAKPRVFNDQRWLLSSRWQYSIFVDNIVHGNTLLERIASTATVDNGAPTMKFLHLMNTHAPFILLEDCATFSEDLLLPSPDAQARCALRAFARVVERLKMEGLYESATIALIADHGYSLATEYQRAEDKWGPWSDLMGSANPVLLLKRPSAMGALARSDEPLAISDVATLVCQSANVNCEITGTPPAQRRERVFAWYRWEDIGWGRPVVNASELGSYTVTGSLWERSSWHHSVALPRRHRLGAPIGFLPADARPELSPFEWSIAQAPGTWAEGHAASIALNFGPTPSTDLEVQADTYAFLPPQRPAQRVIVTANGVEVARWRFDAANPGGLRRARIPRSAMQGGVLRLAFQMPDAVSPLSLGLSDDPRQLSLGLRRLLVTAAADGAGVAAKASDNAAAVRTSATKNATDGKR